MPKPPKANPLAPKACIICYFPTINSRIYCQRCRPHIMSHKMDKLKRYADLIDHQDRHLYNITRPITIKTLNNLI
jgi:hypothetical protein